MPVEDLNVSTPSGATIMRAAPSRRVALHHDVRRNLMGRKLPQDPALPPRRTSRPALPPTRCDGATDQALALSLTQSFVYGGEHERLRKRMHVDKSCSVTARMGHYCWHRGVGPRASGAPRPRRPVAAVEFALGRADRCLTGCDQLVCICRLDPSTQSKDRALRDTTWLRIPDGGTAPRRRVAMEAHPVRRRWRRGADAKLWTGCVSGGRPRTVRTLVTGGTP